ncbi:Carboxylesterase 1 [Cytospora mali]|uniref:Carboxylesterase 1 n=1 Tax=Cytospora mali TaxID=578113 RepID=A0A194UTH1_CYTMA|nr:Carboxylesterase 1 [Valsa mali var. pyri (nom. inval.)]
MAKEFADELFESEASEEIAGRIAGPGKARTLPDLFPTIRWVFPAAPVTRSERFDTHMAQWFDMWSVENPHEKSDVQTDGLRTSVAMIGDLLGEEERGVSRDRIFLAGISQGFTTAVAAFLADGKGVLAGLIGWSSWMPCFEYDAQERQTVPVFLAHAKDDEVVPVVNGEMLHSKLAGMAFDVEWHMYEDGGHWINEPQGMDDMSLFIQRAMST